MNRFSEAQRFFGEYERTGSIGKCREALDILEELIEEDGEDSVRATNFRERIKDRLLEKLNQIAKDHEVAAADPDRKIGLTLSGFSDADTKTFRELLDALEFSSLSELWFPGNKK
jgi:hypothetical protein